MKTYKDFKNINEEYVPGVKDWSKATYAYTPTEGGDEDNPEIPAEPIVTTAIGTIAKNIELCCSDNIPMKPVELSCDIVNCIQDRIANEYNAHYTYRNAANWCRSANYKKAAAFFDKEASIELEHAADLQNYIAQWNIIPVIPTVTVPNSITSLIDAINESYKVEYALLQSYSEMQIKLFNEHPATFNFVQKYVNIQNESVAEFSDLLNALCLIDPNNKPDLLKFEEIYF